MARPRPVRSCGYSGACGRWSCHKSARVTRPASPSTRRARVAIHLRRGRRRSFRRFVHDENVTRALDWIGDVARSVAPRPWTPTFHVDHRDSTTVPYRTRRAPLGRRRTSTSLGGGRLGPHRRGGPGRPGQASRPDDDAALLHMAHWSTGCAISRGTPVLQHTGAAQSELCLRLRTPRIPRQRVPPPARAV